MTRQAKAKKTAIKIAKVMARQLGRKIKNISFDDADIIREDYFSIFGTDRLTRRYDLVSIVAWIFNTNPKERMMESFKKIMPVSLLLCSFYIMGSTFYIVYQNARYNFMASIYSAESRILRDELNEIRYKPDYESGYRDAVIKMGTPTSPGAYTDGFTAAAKIYQNSSYAEGYHNAIKQFGYNEIPNANTKLPLDNIKTSSIKTEDVPVRLAEEK